jgi:probable HAF family extracellular repeat protein
VVGESDNNVSKAFLWDGTNMVNIGTLGGASAVAHDINNAGEIVGASSSGVASRPFKRLGNGTFVDLGTLLGTSNSTGRAWGINEAGVVVGLSRNEASTTSQATLWDNGTIINLGSLHGGTNFSQAYAINDSNVVVGSSVAGKVSPPSSTDLNHAWVWSDGVMTDLGAHPSDTNFIHSEAKDVNNAGEIVGYAAKFFGSPTSGGAAMLWRNGGAIDLNTLVPHRSGWVLQSAEGINDRGDIVGYGSYQGQTRAFMLVRATRLPTGHTDVGVAFEDGAWDLHVHAEDIDAEFTPAEALLTLTPLAQTTVPTNASYAFLGAPGSPTWILPQVENPKLLFLGLGAE